MMQEVIEKDHNFLEIKNRRYYGNKYKLLNFIKNSVNEYIGNDWKTFFDIFAGTGVVGDCFNEEHNTIISNDFLYHNYVALECWLGTKKYNSERLKRTIDYLNNINGYTGYITSNFGNKFFTYNNARKLDAMREEIESLLIDKSISESEYYILLTSFFYAADKCANIITQYEAYLKKLNHALFDKSGKQVTYHGAMKPVILKMPDINIIKNRNNIIFQKDANELIRKIKLDIDILYLDPPYSSRQYICNYHLLENIVSWNKPKLYGKAKKMNCDNYKSLYSRKTNALRAFSAFIKDAINKSKFIVMSYSNRGIMSNSEIEAILYEYTKRKPKIVTRDYNGCHVCTSKVLDNKEKLFIAACRR